MAVAKRKSPRFAPEAFEWSSRQADEAYFSSAMVSRCVIRRALCWPLRNIHSQLQATEKRERVPIRK